MRNSILILLCMLAVVDCRSQSYTPMVRDGNEWGFRYYEYSSLSATIDSDLQKGYFYYINGDTTINGVDYKKVYLKTLNVVYHYDDETSELISSSQTVVDSCFAAIREEDKTVYGVRLASLENLSCGTVALDTRFHGPYWDVSQEGVLYDFNDPLSFAIDRCVAVYGGERATYEGLITTESVTDPQVKVGGRAATRINAKGPRGTLVEGVGLCPPMPWGDMFLFDFLANPMCSPGGELMYMRNADGVYEYLAEGVELSDVNRVRAYVLQPEITLTGNGLNVRVPAEVLPASIEVVALDGRVAAHGIVSVANAQIPLSQLSKGVYAVSIRCAGLSHSGKIVVR